MLIIVLVRDVYTYTHQDEILAWRDHLHTTDTTRHKTYLHLRQDPISYFPPIVEQYDSPLLSIFSV